MDLEDLVSEHAIIPALDADSKKQALHELAAKAAELSGHAIPAREIFDTLLQRERLGSTAMGSGVAIPHTRLPGLTRIVGLFARLETPVDFEAADGQGVDLLFALLAPEEAGADHLRALARVSRLMRNESARAKLRASAETEALHALLLEPTRSRAA